MKYCLLVLFAIQIPPTLQALDHILNQIESPTLIVRVPTSAGKLRQLDIQLNQKSLSQKNKVTIRREIDETIQKTKEYFKTIHSLFIQSYTVGNVLFVPDTLYKRYLEGDTSVFISDAGDIIRIDLYGKNLLHIIQGKDEYQLLLTDKYGNKLGNPWPYKKSTFFSVLKQLFNSKSYLYDQIVWFDQKIRLAMYQEIKETK